MSGSDGDAKSGAGGAAASAAAEPPRAKIDYPTYYTFKALGLSGAVRAKVMELIRGVLGDAAVGDEAITARPSSAGKYEAVSAHVYLRSEDERRRIYEAFHGEKSFVWYV